MNGKVSLRSDKARIAYMTFGSSADLQLQPEQVRRRRSDSCLNPHIHVERHEAAWHNDALVARDPD